MTSEMLKSRPPDATQVDTPCHEISPADTSKYSLSAVPPGEGLGQGFLGTLLAARTLSTQLGVDRVTFWKGRSGRWPIRKQEVQEKDRVDSSSG